MKSPRRKPRFQSDLDLAAEHRMRKRVRDAIRYNYPDADDPPGVGWLVAPSSIQCPECVHQLFTIRIASLEMIQIAYCFQCDEPYELTDQPPQ